MRLGVGFNADLPVSEIVSHGVVAEEQGYDSFWMHEHSFGRDAVSYLEAAAESTSRLRIGVACLNPYTRHPVALAMTMRTVQETSGGRAILGLGTGFPMRLDLLGLKHDRPIAALKETIDICRAIWKGDALTYSGKVYSVKNVKSLVGPTPKPIPIYIAGWKKRMLNLTGKYADGWVAKGGESIVSMKQIARDIESSATAAGRKLSDIELCAYLLTLVEKSSEDALERARRDPFVLYMLSVQDDYLYEGTGIDPEKKKPIAGNYFKGNLPEASNYVTDEMLEAFTLVGTPDHICDRIRDFCKAGLNLPILQPMSLKPMDVKNVLDAGSMLIGDKSE
ncbi:MAG: LLM class flavin-dependent oxidoreductase [Nitrososphaerota archaeon]|nr:LLM class flavin-dependent oxidoreductase [Nitrososphaerota archaeon]